MEKEKWYLALHKTLDGERTWTTHKISSKLGCAYAIAYDPKNDNTLYLGGNVNKSGQYYGVLFKSTDGGKT